MALTSSWQTNQYFHGSHRIKVKVAGFVCMEDQKLFSYLQTNTLIKINNLTLMQTHATIVKRLI